MNTQTFGIIGGLGALAGADLYSKLLAAQARASQTTAPLHVLLEQHPFRGAGSALEQDCTVTARKLYVFETGMALTRRGVDTLLLPCFASHVFRDEIQSEFAVPVVDMLAALLDYVVQRLPAGARLGILTSDYVRHAGLFERYFGDRFQLLYPAPELQPRLMEAIYGVHGIQAGHFDGTAVASLQQVCKQLQAQRVDLLLPGFTELALVAAGLQQSGITFPDVNQIYAEYALVHRSEPPAPRFKLGIVGGVGPAATVDFMNKVIQSTPASRDQDHIKMVVEQNPQIPDRTANLIRRETDPTVALLATCKRLEAEGAHAIAIPCNTAHAFVAELQPLLGIPIVHMLEETIGFIRHRYGTAKPIGLLATSGTVQSRVYHRIAETAGLTLIVPDDEHQAKVMAAIYGEQGVKAGYTSGRCREELLAAARQLADAGAAVLILGCTELPLLLPECEHYQLGGHTLALIDPTAILARRCVELANKR
ncbi:amino acid racemase [Vogesella indigofera]|uniref:amino acid racemase n=1 Tax=Vogesella indigofera TaxID=45465 RepID=UPI00234EE822|nr:amino acid racemase [Vogesella indigofera]MDC7699435.1 amino acid racemase [Vogesella indigofera]